MKTQEKAKKIVKKLQKCRKQYKKLEEEELKANDPNEENEILIKEHDTFAKFCTLLHQLEKIDPQNPELEKGIHNLQYTGL